MNDDWIQFINEKLFEYKIVMKVEKYLNHLINLNKINEFMDNLSVYKIFLLHLMKKNVVFKEILCLKQNIFDIEIEICDKKRVKTNEITNILSKKVENVCEYFHISYNRIEKKYFIGIKLKNNINFKTIQCVQKNVPNQFKIHFLIYENLKDIFTFEKFKFNEIFFTKLIFEDEIQKYKEIIGHLKSMKLPISIVYDELISCIGRGTNISNEVHESILHLETSKKWPENQKAIECAKTAFYCHIFNKSKYKNVIEREYFILEYKRSKFKFKILLKDEEMTKDRIFKGLYDFIKKKDIFFKEGVIIVKRYLECHGYLPLNLTDEMIELICLLFSNNCRNPNKIFMNFLKFEFKGFCCDLDNSTFKDIEEKQIEVIFNKDKAILIYPEEIIERLKFLNSLTLKNNIFGFNLSFEIFGDKILFPSLEDYDFVLSMLERSGFSKIGNKIGNQFMLKEPISTSIIFPTDFFHDLNNFGYFFYSPNYKILMVKSKNNFEVDLLCNLILARTSFQFIKFFEV
ncbi:hypothetical protein LUQ84_002895 [Hamiltosporidium tvaerminnensis]|nr:hypothetical protein LUQ84_002895 [Hamiltosporidium tvaerminnensis]